MKNMVYCTWRNSVLNRLTVHYFENATRLQKLLKSCLRPYRMFLKTLNDTGTKAIPRTLAMAFEMQKEKGYFVIIRRIFKTSTVPDDTIELLFNQGFRQWISV